MTKIAQLQQWMRQKRYFASYEVIKWGSENYCNRADRYRRDLITEGKVRTVTKEEKKRLGYTCKDNVHEWIGFEVNGVLLKREQTGQLVARW